MVEQPIAGDAGVAIPTKRLYHSNIYFPTFCGKLKADAPYLEVSAFYQKMQSQSFIALYIRLAASFASGSNGSTETLQMLWSGYSRKNFAIAFTASVAITSQSPQYSPP
jgi:hypothetical protein